MQTTAALSGHKALPKAAEDAARTDASVAFEAVDANVRFVSGPLTQHDRA